MKYYMTSYRTGEIGYWMPCTGNSLHAAKLEATKRYRDEFIDAEIRVAVGDNIVEERVILAAKKVRGHWRNF